MLQMGFFSFSRFTIITGGVVALGCCFCPTNCSEGPGIGGFGLFSSFVFAMLVSISFSSLSSRYFSFSVGVFVILITFLNGFWSFAICVSISFR